VATGQIVSDSYYYRPVSHMPVTVRPAELAAQLRVAVWRAARRLRHESDVGLTPTLYAALGTVEIHGPLTAGQLAGHEHVRKPTMTRTIRELVDRELIERLPDPLDGRVTWLQVTRAGADLIRSARRRSETYLTKQLRALTPQERETLQRAAVILESLVERGDA
jgi:DNA-binding MarR family transcriptional regulator